MGTTGITTLTGNATFNVSNSTGGGAGTLYLGALNFGGTARTVTFGGNGSTTLNYQAQNEVSGTQVNITGGTLNSNVGGTATSPGSLGSFAQVNIGSGATLVLGASQTISSLSGGGNVNLGNNTLTIGNTDNFTPFSPFAGTISDAGAGSPGSIIKAGTGTLYLAGPNTYNGGTTVLAGTLAVGNNSALGTGAVTLTTGTTLRLAGVQSSIADGGAIGIHWNTDQNGNGNQVGSVAATAMAGAPGFAMQNWNNAFNPTARATETTANVVSPVAGVLVNSLGAPTGVTVSYSGGGNYSSGNYTTPDNSLMGTFLNDGGTNGTGNTVTFSNIPYSSYEVVAYVGSEGGAANNRPGGVTIGSAPTFYFQTDTFPGSNPYTYIQITNTTSGTYPSGNYAVATGLSGSTLTVTDGNVTGDSNVGLPAIEIINTAPAVTTLALPNAVVVNGPSTIDLTGTGADSISGGLSLGTTLLSVTGGSTGTNVPYTLTLTGQTMLSGSPVITVSNNGTGTGSLVLQGGLNANNVPVSLALLGNGTVTLGAPATGFVPGTVVNVYNGTLNASVAGALGTATNLNVLTGTTFDMNATGASQTFSGLGGGGTVNVGANTLTIGNSDSLSSTFSGTLSDGGQGGSLRIGGNGFTGKFTLAGAGNYSGSTMVNSGTFALATSGSLANTAITVNGGGTFAPQLIGGSTRTIGSATTIATMTLSSGTLDLSTSNNIGTFVLQQRSSFSGTALTIDNAALNFNVSSTGADELLVSGPSATSSVAGTNIVNIAGLGSGLTNGAIHAYRLSERRIGRHV